jgi:methylmalonyl-CoA decarboxylase
MESFVKFEIINSISFITIDNPNKKNAISPDMIEEMIKHIKSLEVNKSIRAIIIKGEGNKVFSSGYDISSIKEDYNDQNHPLIRMTKCIKDSGKIVVAAINGHAFGGGLEIAISCDFRFFSKNSIFCVPPAKLGIPYSYNGLKNFINCIGLSNTKNIFLTADKFNSDDALSMGLANFVYDSEEIIDEATNFCERISQNAPLSLEVIKKSINSFQESQTLDNKNKSIIEDLIKNIQESKDFVEGRKAFEEKRTPKYEGS